MRKLLSLFFGMVLLSLLPNKAWCQEAYAWLSEDGKTLTFCYDNDRATKDGTTFDLNEGNVEPDWYWYCFDQINNAVIEPSFTNARPKSTYNWFGAMTNLQEIEGLNYLNTSEVTTMACMFYFCSSLTSLDLSSFDTSNVTDMDLMFGYCTSLTSLDVSNFDFSKTNETSKPFYNCYGLNSFIISSSMSNLGDEACLSAGFSEEYPCYIIAPEGFDFGVDTSGDYFMWKGGYFTLKAPEIPDGREAYAVYDNGIFTFYYDDLKSTRDGQVYGISEWLYYNGRTTVQTLTDVNKVVIDPSFVDARPTAMNYWFQDMGIETIEGMQYLNTSNVTEMFGLFMGCRNLKNLDLSHFDTSSLGNMGCMFALCSSLEELDLSNFNTSNVFNMNQVFMNCTNLKSINLSSFDTSNVSSFTATFANCSSLETLDVSNFDTSNAIQNDDEWWKGSESMFYGCSNLKNLSVSSTMSTLNDNACENVGTPENPCLIIAPEGFDFGTETSGNYFVWKLGYFMTGSTTPLVTLSNGDNEVPLSEYDGMTVDVELEEYTCQPEKWYSLCVPFDISNEQLKEAFGDDVDIQEMTGCAWNSSEQTLDMNFNKVTEVLAGRPYLLRVNSAVEAPQFDGVTINSDDPLTLNFGNCTMTGVLNATPLPLGDKSYLFIINNKFYYPATTNPLPAMRCYFHLLGDAAQANSVALNMENDADGIVSLISDSAADSRVYYSVQGVSTTRPQHGIYINNGRKVVIK